MEAFHFNYLLTVQPSLAGKAYYDQGLNYNPERYDLKLERAALTPF